MSERRGLMRLARLYGTVEQMRSYEVRVAAGAVDEVAVAEARQRGMRGDQVRDGRAAMVAGDREQWQVAETAREIAEMRIVWMREMKVEREAKAAEAMEVHRASRLQAEQMHSVVERRRAGQAVVEERRVQAAADDRFASRRAWDLVREGRGMKRR